MRAVDIGGGSAVLGIDDIRVLHQIVFLIYDRPFPSDEHNSVFVIQKSDFIGGHKLTACLLGTLRIRSVFALSLAARCGDDCLLAELLGDIFVGALLISAEIDHGVGVADNAFPVVFEQGFELGDV